MRLRLGVLLVLAAALLAPAARMARAQLAPPAPAVPGAALREQEMAECRPGEQQTWGDGRDRAAITRPLRFVYRHEGAPPWFTPEQVMGLVQRAAQAWSACGVASQVRLLPRGEAPPEGVVQILWSEVGSRGQFGLANVAARSLSLGPGVFGLLRQRNPRHPAEQTLQMVLSHEMGHFYGLMAHSRRCVDVMSYYDDGRGQRCSLRDPRAWGSVPEYRATLPTACDLQRCRALNSQP
jgi:hypothetical protein